VAALQKQLQPGDHYNILLGFPGFPSRSWVTPFAKGPIPGLDPHQDSPVEILHTISLGQTRYLWFSTASKWNEEKDQKFIAWLRASNVDGLAGVPHGVQAHYLVDFRNNLVGKNFKWISQLTVFNLHQGSCDPIVFDLWKATGELCALLWCTKILDMDQYVVTLITPITKPPALITTPCYRLILTSQSRMSLTYGQRLIPTASLSNPNSTFSRTFETMYVGLVLQPYTKWNLSRHQTKCSVSAASFPIITRQAMILR